MRQETYKSKNKENIDAEVTAHFGHLASIVSVKEVQTGGMGGFFASREYVALVEVPESGDQTVPVLNEVIDTSNIANLLSDDVFDQTPAVRGRRTGAPLLVTEPLGKSLGAQLPAADKPDLAKHSIPEVMRMVSRDTTGEALTIYVGLFNDTIDLLGRKAYQAGELNDTAEPVSGEVAFGVGDGSSTKVWAERIARLNPDRVFAVVDASRKHEDSAAWVHELDSIIKVVGVCPAPYGARTITPGTLDLLGLPVSIR